MKKLKRILPLLIAALFMPIAMTSCLNSDDDNNQLSDEQIKNAITTMSGNYRGKLYFYDTKKEELQNKNYNDSIENISVKFNYPESAYVIYDFPARLLFKNIDNHADLKEAVEEEYIDLKIKYVPYQIAGLQIYYYMQPETVSMNLYYGGTYHDIKVAFLLNTMGVYFKNSSKEYQDLQLVEGAIYDGTDSNGQPQLLDGKALYSTSMSDKEAKSILFEFYGNK